MLCSIIIKSTLITCRIELSTTQLHPLIPSVHGESSLLNTPLLISISSCFKLRCGGGKRVDIDVVVVGAKEKQRVILFVGGGE